MEVFRGLRVYPDLFMNQKLLKTIVFILLLVFYGSFLLYQIDLPAADDLPRQMKNGEDILHGRFDVLTKNVYSYTEPDQTFGNHHWGSGVIFYLLHQAVGYDGMSVFKVVLMLFTFALLFHVAAKKADFWLVAFLSLPVILILLGRSSFRPEMFSYFFVALYLYFLNDLEEHPERKRIFWLIPFQLVWTNMHIFFVAGILLVGGFLFEKLVLASFHGRKGFSAEGGSAFGGKNLKKNILVKKLILLLACLTLVIFINPFGLIDAFTGFELNSTEDSPISSAETVSVSSVLRSSPKSSNIPAVIFMPLVILSALSFVAGFWKKSSRQAPIFYFLATAGTAVLGYHVVRSLPLFGLMLLPAVSGNLNGVFITVKKLFSDRWPEREKVLRELLPIILIAVLLYFTFLARELIRPYEKIGIGITTQSESSANFFKEQGLKGPIFNDTDIGSYIIGNLYPQEKVFSDNRFRDAYSAGFFKNIYTPIIWDDEVWKIESDRYNFNVIFLYHYGEVDGIRKFIQNRMRDYDWPLVYADEYAVIFIKRNEENRGIIDKFQITPDNAGNKLSHLLESTDSDEMIAGADLLALMGRFDLAMLSYMKVVSQWPERGKVWLVLGRTELTRADQQNSNPTLALLFMQQAINHGWKTWESYSYLALAYFRTGQLDKAREAVNEELKLDPNNEDGKLWLDNLDKAEKEARQK